MFLIVAELNDRIVEFTDLKTVTERFKYPLLMKSDLGHLPNPGVPNW